MSRRIWLAICAIALGCSHPAPAVSPPAHVTTADAGVFADARPVALDDDLPRLAERAVAMYQELARELAASQDCAVTTAKLEAIESSYADVIAANHRVLHGGHDKIKRLHDALEPHQADFDAAAQTIVQSPTMRACSQDASFAHAIDELIGEPS